jgi:hypothetical protein
MRAKASSDLGRESAYLLAKPLEELRDLMVRKHNRIVVACGLVDRVLLICVHAIEKYQHIMTPPPTR